MLRLRALLMPLQPTAEFISLQQGLPNTDLMQRGSTQNLVLLKEFTLISQKISSLSVDCPIFNRASSRGALKHFQDGIFFKSSRR